MESDEPGQLQALSPGERLRVPLALRPRHLEPMVDEALGLDRNGEARFRQDQCAEARISDLRLGVQAPHVTVSVALSATLATPVLGNCVGAGNWEGRLHALLSPAPGADGLDLTFRAHSAELRRPDGAESLLTVPTRLIAENLIMPRLARTRVDLAEPLATVDRLAAPSMPDAPALVQRTRLTDFDMSAEALLINLELTVRPGRPAASPEPALGGAELARWARLEDELDGFLTAVMVHLASRAEERGLRLEMLASLLDARHGIARALANDEATGRDPVRDLFLQTWSRTRPLVESLSATGALPPDHGLRLATFVSAADALAAADALGPDYGVEITRDGLRRLARLLLADDAPDSFTPLPLGRDERLRRLLRGDGATRVNKLQERFQDGGWFAWLLSTARAEEQSSVAERLRGQVPQRAGLDDYLALVERLLIDQADMRLAGEPRLPGPYHPLLTPMVKATAWKESCWRQYAGSPENPSVLESAAGALGMMQISARVWRGVYDLDRLADDIAYNVAAGIDILEHYFVDYALRRGEHDHAGGRDNLVRATYAAYNGGPGQMARYRLDDTPQRLRAIDAEFWRQYSAVLEQGRPVVSSCY